MAGCAMIALCYHRSMGQVLIRNLDDELLADYREAAERNQRSLEAELRAALRTVRPIYNKPNVYPNAHRKNWYPSMLF